MKINPTETFIAYCRVKGTKTVLRLSNCESFDQARQLVHDEYKEDLTSGVLIVVESRHNTDHA